jgi:ankyrin repeat protein
MSHDPVREHPIWRALCNNQTDVVRRWLEDGVDVNMVDDGEDTLLDHAIYNRDLEIVELLIEKHICINRSVNGHPTPLQLAASCSWVDGARMLIKYNAKLDADISPFPSGSPRCGWSPLDYAISQNRCIPAGQDYDPQLDMVRLLIHSGADVFARHADGETLLMRAARWGNEGVVLALISAGVDLKAEDCMGKTALDYAVQRGKFRIEAILRDPYSPLPRESTRSERRAMMHRLHLEHEKVSLCPKRFFSASVAAHR